MIPSSWSQLSCGFVIDLLSNSKFQIKFLKTFKRIQCYIFLFQSILLPIFMSWNVTQKQTDGGCAHVTFLLSTESFWSEFFFELLNVIIMLWKIMKQLQNKPVKAKNQTRGQHLYFCMIFIQNRTWMFK